MKNSQKYIITWGGKDKTKIPKDELSFVISGDGHDGYTYRVTDTGSWDPVSMSSADIDAKTELILQHSMSAGDQVLVAAIEGLPDTDYFGDFEFWAYSGSDIREVVSLTTSSVYELLHGATGSTTDTYLNIDTTSAIDDGVLKLTPSHIVLVKSASVWSFEEAGNVKTEYKMLSSSLEEVDIDAVTAVSASERTIIVQHYDIEPYDTYFVNGVLVHN